MYSPLGHETPNPVCERHLFDLKVADAMLKKFQEGSIGNTGLGLRAEGYKGLGFAGLGGVVEEVPERSLAS